MAEERWLAVPGFPGYEVSDRGGVRSFWRHVKLAVGRGSRCVLGDEPRTLKHQVCRDGRHVVCLYRNSVPKRCRVHLLVLEAFVGPCPKGMVGCHGPAGNDDNSVSNIYWGTLSTNNGADRHRDGTAICGERLPWTKLTARDVLQIRRGLRDGVTPLALSEQFGVTRALIYEIKNRKVWAWLPEGE